MSAAYGTPMRFTLLKIAGALPSMARPYSVREPMYRSEFAALSTKIRMQALMMLGRVRMPTSFAATTNGDAAAPVFAFVAVKRVSSVLGTVRPMTKTPPI